jgi:hypothetical protein
MIKALLAFFEAQRFLFSPNGICFAVAGIRKPDEPK